MRKMMWWMMGAMGSLAMGCETESTPPAEETPEEETCEHLGAAAGQAVTAAADPTATSVPDVSPVHKRFDVTLPASAAQNAGWVKVAIGKAGDYALALNDAVPVHVQHADGTTLNLKEPPKFPCTTVKQAHKLTLTVGTWHIRLGPTALPKVGLLVEEL